MPIDSRIHELLSHLEDARARGQAPTPEELCAGCPELLEELKRRIPLLNSAERMLQGSGAADAISRADTHTKLTVASTKDKEIPTADRRDLPQIPGYVVLAELGRGGMGVVYQARHIELNRLVAVKMIRGGSHAAASERARFRSEAEAVAGLQHPNIVQIHDIGECQGQPYISLKCCAGGSLADRITGQPQLAQEAAALIEVLARAVHFAHQHKVVHRDLKPSNVLG